jgi:hypothetical protein
MERKDFKDYFENTVAVLADKICEENPAFHFTKNFDGLFEEYLNQRTLLKLLIKKMDDPPEKQNLDRHKVAACITVAVMKTRLIYIDDIDDVNNSYSLGKASRMNEQLAFLCGLNLVISYMLVDSEIDSKIKNTLGNFMFPKTRYEKYNENIEEGKYIKYIDSIIRGLYYTNISYGFPILLLSNIFFLLEEYHKLSVSVKTTASIAEQETV